MRYETLHRGPDDQYKPNTWECRIEGPWYEDSAPRGSGKTEGEAKEQALQKLLGIKSEIDNFLEMEGLS